MKPFIKWAGGKEREIKTIKDYFPTKINNYIEPFLGGGAVYLYLAEQVDVKKCFVNDFSSELIGIYKMILNQNQSFFNELELIDKDLFMIETIALYNKTDFVILLEEWIHQEMLNLESVRENCKKLYTYLNFQIKNDDLDFENQLFFVMKNKINSLRKIRNKNTNDNLFLDDVLETVLKSLYYIHIRYLYNFGKEDRNKNLAYFFFVREYCYSSMFRYNSKGVFNVPYGGSGYNKKNLSKKIAYLHDSKLIEVLKDSTINNLDFEKFINNLIINDDDFIFVDPPYDSEFSEYAQNEFSRKDQIRLANTLANLKCKVMVVIKNTDFIFNLYHDLGFNIITFDKKYSVNFMNRNDRAVKHLIIKNY